MNVILPLWNHSSLPNRSIEHLIEEARIILRSFSSWFVNRKHYLGRTKNSLILTHFPFFLKENVLKECAINFIARNL